MLVDDTRAVVTPLRGGAVRSQDEIDEIRGGLQRRYEELQAEYEQVATETQVLSREHLADAAGDDDADTGTKTSEREREMSVLRNISERLEQVETALQRLAQGAYGWCERCSAPIPVERLSVFPWATSCVRCKTLLERRAS
jgi:DnaK suppressor protein